MHYHLVILRAYWDEEIQEVKGVPHQVIVCKVIDTANQTPCRKHILSLVDPLLVQILITTKNIAKRSRKARYEGALESLFGEKLIRISTMSC
ncbi:unnamed protein product [Rhizophagus irregularis]|nr:unnamed protein product [Rhizophagus irregularis]